MKILTLLFALTFSLVASAAPIKLSELPTYSGASTVNGDSFVFVNTQEGNFTYRLPFGDIPSIPSVAAAFALKQNVGPYITGLFGDVVAAGPGSVNSTIQNGVVSNIKLAVMPQGTIKGRLPGVGTGLPSDLSGSQIATIIPAFTGDSGAGGVKGLVPAPAAGDGAAGKVLNAAGNWVTPFSATLPDQTGQAGKFLSTDGVNGFWSDSGFLPTIDMGSAGKFLSNDGTDALWQEIDVTGLESGISAAQDAADAAQEDIDNHISDTTAAHAASAISVTATGGILATDVQAALEELDSEISGIGGDAITGLSDDVSATGPGVASATVNSVGGKTASEISDTVDDVAAATDAGDPSTLMKRDADGEVTAAIFHGDLNGNVTGNVTGNADTATALASNPSDCASNQFANAIAANGNLTCSAIAVADLPGPTASAISASDIDWSVLVKRGGVYTKTLGANTTFTFSNLAVGTIVVRLTNTASNYTVDWPTVKWAGGEVPVMSEGAVSDIFTFVYDGTDVYGSVVQNMQ